MDSAGALLLEARRRAGMSQRAAASAAGVRQPVISRIETGREEPGVATLGRLVEACGFELRLDLESRPDPGDLALLETTLLLTPQQRVDRLLAVHEVAGELQEAMRTALARRAGEA